MYVADVCFRWFPQKLHPVTRLRKLCEQLRALGVDSDELFRRESTLEVEYDHDQIEGREICR